MTDQTTQKPSPEQASAREVYASFDEAEHATVIAALRFYQEHGQGEPANRSDATHDLATNCGEVFSSLDDEGIDTLVERLNFAGDLLPAVVVELNGGVVNCVRTSVPVRVVLLDYDTEGGEAEFLREVNGEGVYLHDYTGTLPAQPGGSGVDGPFVIDVLEQLAPEPEPRGRSRPGHP